jgi:hypothetical protein
MGIVIRLTEKQERIWREWVASRPDHIRAVIEKYNLRPDRLYKLKDTNQRVILHSIDGDGTIKIDVLDKYNQHLMNGIIPKLYERRVFGINPADLEECKWDGEVIDGRMTENDSDEDPDTTVH